MTLWGSPLTERDLSVYVSFVGPLIIGRLDQADALMHQEGATVEKVARYFRSRIPPGKKKLYRGWLIDPVRLAGAETPQARARRVLQGDVNMPKGKFLSFSEDRDTACFFADPDSWMSVAIMARQPRLRGYLMEYPTPNPAMVLWTYRWRQMPIGERSVDLVQVVLRSSLAQDAAVIDRNLREQFEVVTKLLPPGEKTTIRPLAESGCPPTNELDARFGG